MVLRQVARLVVEGEAEFQLLADGGGLYVDTLQRLVGAERQTQCQAHETAIGDGAVERGEELVDLWKAGIHSSHIGPMNGKRYRVLLDALLDLTQHVLDLGVALVERVW